jgi:hypothetical protein
VWIVVLRWDAFQSFIESATAAKGAMAGNEIMYAAQIEFELRDCSYIFIVRGANISTQVCLLFTA